MYGEKEERAHWAVCTYLKVAYPKAIYNTDMSGVRLTMSQAKTAKNLRSSNAFPDLVIYEQRHGFGALFIELKRPDLKLYKKDGSLISNKHIQQQNEMLKALESRGYCARFAVGFSEAKKIIDWYLKG